MRALAMTGIETASMMPSIMSGSLIRDTPPWARMSAGTRSRAITATAPASSAIFACSALTTSMITPPLSISARPLLTRIVPVSCIGSMLPRRVFLLGPRQRPDVGPVCPEVGALPVVELDDDHGRLVAADDQAVGVDDLRLFVVFAVLRPRSKHAVADGIWILDHAPIIGGTLTSCQSQSIPPQRRGASFVRSGSGSRERWRSGLTRRRRRPRSHPHRRPPRTRAGSSAGWP